MTTLIAGCTTIPSRTKFLPRVIDQIEKQTLKPDVFCIGVPSRSTRENTDYDLEWIRELAKERSERSGFKVVVSLLEEDYGPLCKLAGMLAVAPENSLLVTVDDDHIYDEKLLETLVRGYNEFQGSCVCLCGHALGRVGTGFHWWGYRQTGYDENPFGKALQLSHGSQVDIISGWAGVLYSRSMFGQGQGLKLPEDLEFYRRSDAIKGLHRNDDLYISAWLSAASVPRVVIAYSGKYTQKQATEIGSVNPLCHDGHKSWIKGHATHFVNWWKLIRQLESHGYFAESAKVPLNKSFTLYGALIGAVAAAAIVGCCIYASEKRRKGAK